MKALLNGKEVSPAIFAVNVGLNYGRFFDLKSEAYEMQLSISEFKKLIEGEYNSVRDEIKKDDVLYKDTSDFTNTNYCSLSELLEHKNDFEEVVKTYLDKKLFAKMFNDSVLNKYVINSTDAVIIDKNIISFKGKVFKKKN